LIVDSVRRKKSGFTEGNEGNEEGQNHVGKIMRGRRNPKSEIRLSSVVPLGAGRRVENPKQIRIGASCGGGKTTAAKAPLGGLEKHPGVWKIPGMKTVTVDGNKRVRIPNVKPGQIFAYDNHGDGTITLTEVKAERKERFPRGSLLKYITPERDKEQLAILKSCVQGPE
jgi:hypothetical protein